jgi:VanZ family protein
MKFKYWVPVFLWVGFLFLMSTDMFSSHATFPIIARILRLLDPSISARQIDLMHAIIRKLAHVTEYFIFGILLFRAFRSGSLEPRALNWALSSLVVLALLAASDEFHQSLTVERTASIVDVCIDSFGGFLAMCVSIFLFRRNRKRNLAAQGIRLATRNDVDSDREKESLDKSQTSSVKSEDS